MMIASISTGRIAILQIRSKDRVSSVSVESTRLSKTKLTLQLVVRRIFALVEHIVRLGLQFEVFR
jgi:hypothetical protein